MNQVNQPINQLNNPPNHWEGKCYPCGHSSTWCGVFSGALVAVGLTVLFNLLTMGLSLELFAKTNPDNSLALTFLGLSWLIVGGYAIMFIAGWNTGKKVCHVHCCPCGAGFLFGFKTWTVYLIMTLILVAIVASTPSIAFLQKVFINVLTGSTFTSAGIAPDHTTNTVENAHRMGLATLSTFLIFAIGALGSCVGAYCGIKHKKACWDKEQMGMKKVV